MAMPHYAAIYAFSEQQARDYAATRFALPLGKLVMNETPQHPRMSTLHVFEVERLPHIANLDLMLLHDEIDWRKDLPDGPFVTFNNPDLSDAP